MLRHLVCCFCRLLIVWMAARRRLSCYVYRTHCWVSIFESLRAWFILTYAILDHSCSGRVKHFIGYVFSESSIDLSWETSGGSRQWLLSIFSCNSCSCLRFVQASVHFLVFHHIHANILHVHVGHVQMACSHADHRSRITPLWSCSV